MEYAYGIYIYTNMRSVPVRSPTHVMESTLIFTVADFVEVLVGATVAGPALGAAVTGAELPSTDPVTLPASAKTTFCNTTVGNN